MNNVFDCFIYVEIYLPPAYGYWIGSVKKMINVKFSWTLAKKATAADQQTPARERASHSHLISDTLFTRLKQFNWLWGIDKWQNPVVVCMM